MTSGGWPGPSRASRMSSGMSSRRSESTSFRPRPIRRVTARIPHIPIESSITPGSTTPPDALRGANRMTMAISATTASAPTSSSTENRIPRLLPVRDRRRPILASGGRIAHRSKPHRTAADRPGSFCEGPVGGSELRLLRLEPAPREDEQHEAAREEHADERVQLGRAGQEHREEPEQDADPVDQQDGLAMAQPDIEQAVVEMPAVRRERRSALGK